MLCNDASLTDQQFGHNIVSQKFPAALSFLNLQETLSLFGQHFIFSYDFKSIENLITSVNWNVASRESLIIFIALMVSPSANWRAWPWQYIKWNQSHLFTVLLYVGYPIRPWSRPFMLPPVRRCLYLWKLFNVLFWCEALE